MSNYNKNILRGFDQQEMNGNSLAVYADSASRDIIRRNWHSVEQLPVLWR